MLAPTVRRTHVAGGEKNFVDRADTTAEVVDPEIGERLAVQVFVTTPGRLRLRRPEPR